MSTIVSLPTAPSAPGYQTLESPLVFTPAAAAKVRELIHEEGNEALALRVYIQGGGCSGFQYGFEFDENRADDDLAVVTEGNDWFIWMLSDDNLMGFQRSLLIKYKIDREMIAAPDGELIK